MHLTDGYGAGLDRTNVCHDSSQTVTVMITDTCKSKLDINSTKMVQPLIWLPLCRPLQLPAKLLQQQAVVLWRLLPL